VIDNGPYSHDELVFSDGMSASASWMDDGVRFKEINFDPALWDFIDHEGEPYDLMGNLRFLCGVVREFPCGWFCSEAKAAALGLTEPWRYGPNGLANILRDMWTK
jgi:hypothetical protein